jgi:putative ABC transport system substrate-binding protein
MRRREFILGLSGAAALPFGARAQPADVRRLGILFVLGESHPEVASFLAAIKERLQTLGWAEGRNLKLDVRYANSDPERVKRYTEELLSLKPDVIFAQGVVGAAAFQQATKSVPVIFVQVQDPVGGGFVKSLANPDGNLTGFTNFEYSIVSKWLQLLKDVSPGVTRVMPIINPDNRARWNGYTAAFESFAPALGLRPMMAGVHDAGEIERAIAAFVTEPNGGMVVLPDATTAVHATLIIELAKRHRLPAVYSYGFYARAGGLIAYSDSVLDQYRGAASYVDRVLRGAKVSELPIQATDRFETVLNLKTAAAMGLAVTPGLIARADEVIE